MDDFDESIIAEKSIKDEIKYNDVNVLRYSVFYPELTEGETRERINAYYFSRKGKRENYIKNRLFRETVLRYKRSVADLVPFFATQVTGDFHTSCLNETFFSLYEDYLEYMGGADRQTVRSAQTWHLAKGKRLRLGEFFRKKTHWRTLVLSEVTGIMREQIKEQNVTYLDNWELMVRRHFNQNHFYLAEEGFNLFYQAATIAPQSEGIIVFTLPYQTFAGALNFGL